MINQTIRQRNKSILPVF